MKNELFSRKSIMSSGKRDNPRSTKKSNSRGKSKTTRGSSSKRNSKLGEKSSPRRKSSISNRTSSTKNSSQRKQSDKKRLSNSKGRYKKNETQRNSNKRNEHRKNTRNPNSRKEDRQPEDVHEIAKKQSAESIVEYRTDRAQKYAERQRSDNSIEQVKTFNRDTFKPVSKKGKRQYLKKVIPHSWSSKGEGVFIQEIKIEGQYSRKKRTLVWGGIPNEESTVSVLDGRNQNYAWFQSTDNPSSHRQSPICDLYTKCGGCALMHVVVEEQQNAKLEILRSHIEKTDTRKYHDEEKEKERKYGAIISTKIPSNMNYVEESQLGYRHVAKLVAGRTEIGNFRLGMRNSQGYIVAVPECHVVTPLIRKQTALVAHLCTEMNIFPYDSEIKKGLRHVVIRESKYKNQTNITLVVALGPIENRKGIPIGSSIWAKLAEELMIRDGSITGIWIHLNDREGNRIFDFDQNGSIHAQRLLGKTSLVEKVNDLEYEIGVGDFFQVNIDTAALLQRRVVEISKKYSTYPMVDLYCGVGFFTLALAQEHGFALGIEGVRTAIERANINAKRNQINARFKAEWAIDLGYTVKNEIGEHHPFLIVDPARRGLEDGVFEEIMEVQPVAVLYISCGPRGLHRDMRMFLEAGWTIDFMEAYDMFPQTPHIETLTLFIPPYTCPESKWRVPTRRISVPKMT